MKVKSGSEVTQSCPTLGDPMDYSPPGSSVHGISRQEYWSGVPLPSLCSLFIPNSLCLCIPMLPLPSSLSPLVTTAAAAAKSLQSCPTLCCPIDSSPPASPVPRILQARTLKWVAISFSNAWKWKVKVKSLSRVRLSATPWTAAYQVPPSMGFSRQEYWSGVQLLSSWWPLPYSLYLWVCFFLLYSLVCFRFYI